MTDFIYSYFNFKPESFLSNLTFCIALTVIVIGIFRPIMNRYFRGGWRYALWIVLPLCFLVPVKIKLPFSVVPLFDIMYLPLKIKSPPRVFTVGEYFK